MTKLFTGLSATLRQPLVHFLVLGAAIFLVYQFVGGRQTDTNVVIVDEQALLTFVQYRSKAFSPERAERTLASLSAAAFERLVQDYVREEVLYREALAMHMERGDYIIKRRLMQKVEFVTSGLIESASVLSDDEIAAWYDSHRDDYYIVPSVTFAHVFFNAEQRGTGAARELALQTLARLNRDGVAFDEGARLGDRFLYHTNYVERTADFVASHFGADMAQAVFRLAPDSARWQGPFASPYGSHLVMLTRNVAGRHAAFGEVRDQVGRDARREALRRRSDAAIQAMVDNYDVRVTYTQPAGDRSEGDSP